MCLISSNSCIKFSHKRHLLPIQFLFLNISLSLFSIISMELIVEGSKVLKDLLHMASWVDQVGDAEVIGVILLSEA